MPCIVILLINTIPDHQGRFKIIIQSVQTELKGRCIPMYGSSRSQFFQGMFFPALVIITVITGFIQRNRQQILFCQCIRLHDITIGFLPGKKHIRRYLPTKPLPDFSFPTTTSDFPEAKPPQATKPCPHCKR